MPASLLHPVRAVFRSVAATVVPEAASLNTAEWLEVEQVVEVAIAQRPPKMQRQLVLFLRLIELMPLARFGKKFSRLDGPRRTLFLHGLERSKSLLVRRGFWGLRTLVFSGYYTRPAVAARIGYRAHRDGWAARGGTDATVPMSSVEVWVEPR